MGLGTGLRQGHLWGRDRVTHRAGIKASMGLGQDHPWDRDRVAFGAEDRATGVQAPRWRRNPPWPCQGAVVLVLTSQRGG